MRLIKRLLIALMLIHLVSCATSPTGRNQLILIPDAQMDQMGVASFTDMKQKTPPSKDEKSFAYVNCISTALLKATGENPNAWEVQVFQDDSPNAFALPGRKIGVHTGMIDLAENQEQLAAVIGHEIGHVQAKHGAERVSMNVSAQVVQQAASVGLADNENSQMIMTALGLGAQYGVLLPYSRTHESEADYLGLIIMAHAGFDPAQSVELWKNMAKSGGKKPPEFMSTHPSDKTRINELSDNMQRANKLYQAALAKGNKINCPKP